MNTRFRFISLALVCVLAVTVLGIGSPVNAQTKLSGKLEIFSWWAGAEAPALDALLKLYNTKYPDVKVVNATVAGGSGVNARAVLKTRMLGGKPPDSFQVHAGKELIGTWVVAGRMEPLDDLYKSEGWMDKFPKGLIDMMTFNGHIWSVAVNIHRSNVMWYIPANLKKWGVEVPKTWDDFFTVCTTLKKARVTPLALGPTWTAEHLFENVLLATLGPDDYTALWAGKLNWTDDKVKAAWTTFGKVLDCTNKDAASLGDWVPPAKMIIDGKAAFQIMGDWWYGAGAPAVVAKMQPGKDFGYTTAPGTDGVYLMLSDSFGLPKDIADRDNTLAWLKMLGSAEAEDAFNPLKGALPPRIDADLKNAKLYNQYFQDAAKDWASNKIVPSVTHGAAAPETFTSPFADVIAQFVTNRDADVAAGAAQLAAIQAGIIIVQ